MSTISSDVRNVLHHRGNLISGTVTRRIIFAIPTKHKWLSLHSLQYSSFIRCHNPWMAGMACRDCTLLNVASEIKSIYCIISSSPEFSQNWSLSWEPRPLLKMVWPTHCVFFSFPKLKANAKTHYGQSNNSSELEVLLQLTSYFHLNHGLESGQVTRIEWTTSSWSSNHHTQKTQLTTLTKEIIEQKNAQTNFL